MTLIGISSGMGVICKIPSVEGEGGMDIFL